MALKFLIIHLFVILLFFQFSKSCLPERNKFEDDDQPIPAKSSVIIACPCAARDIDCMIVLHYRNGKRMHITDYADLETTNPALTNFWHFLQLKYSRSWWTNHSSIATIESTIMRDVLRSNFTGAVLLPNKALLLAHFSAGMNGAYHCECDGCPNLMGNTVSRAIVLRTTSLSYKFNVVPPRAVYFRPGDSIILPCEPPVGWPRPSVLWQKNGKQLPASMISSGNLILTNLTEKEEGEYTCWATQCVSTSAMQDLSIAAPATLLELSFEVEPSKVTSNLNSDLVVLEFNGTRQQKGIRSTFWLLTMVSIVLGVICLCSWLAVFTLWAIKRYKAQHQIWAAGSLL